MMASYSFSERYNAQVVLWAIGGALVGAVRTLLVVGKWAVTILYAAVVLLALVTLVSVEAAVRWMWAHRAGLWAGVVVLTQVAAWMTLLAGAVVLAVLYWHVIIALGGIVVVAWVTYPRSK